MATRTVRSSFSPDFRPRSPDYEVVVNGKAIDVHLTEVASFCQISLQETVQVEVTVEREICKPVLRPLQRGLELKRDGKRLTFTVDRPGFLVLEVDDDLKRPLFLFADPSGWKPDLEGFRKVTAFNEPGRIHDIGLHEMEDGEAVVIGPGVVVRGAFLAEGKTNVAILGLGIHDGALLEQTLGRTRMMRFHNCHGVRVEGVTLVDGPTWNLVPVGCDGVTIRNVKIFNGAGTGDGFDLVGSRNVLLEHCFARTKDDCVAIKAIPRFHPSGGNDVENITVRDSVFWNAEWGNAIEIGYETCCNRMRGIRFQNIDIIRCEEERYSSGGAITVHNGDRAEISDVLYEDIRIEDAREKLFDLKIVHSRYSKDEERGQLRDLVFRNIQVVDGRFPPSIIQGFDRDHIIQNICFENWTFRGEKVKDFLDARMITEFWKDVRFT